MALRRSGVRFPSAPPGLPGTFFRRQSFMKAVLLQPNSITSYFDFPQGGYYDRGSDENGLHC